jgi:APA family basic amino acid/polyamine antiporter
MVNYDKSANWPMTLKRELGVFGATMMGLGSIIGTGVFVSIGIAAGVAGSAVIVAIAMAALVATCNALSSAQLAASHPVSGGTYEYGYRYLKPWLGFVAGWMFLCAKTASAATAALGFAGYFLIFFGRETSWLIPLAIATVVILTAIVLSGIRLSSRVNVFIVSITLASLTAFVVAGLPAVSAERLAMQIEPTSLLHASALMFVAYTGYGRIATLGEEVVEPHRTIPKGYHIDVGNFHVGLHRGCHRGRRCGWAGQTTNIDHKDCRTVGNCLSRFSVASALAGFNWCYVGNVGSLA